MNMTNQYEIFCGRNKNYCVFQEEINLTAKYIHQETRVHYKQIVPGTRCTLLSAVSHRTTSNEYRRLPLGVVSNLLMIPDVSITKREHKTVSRDCLIQRYSQPTFPS